ncbi:MAG: MliC family protein [Betaproteobacteria bacterium]|nr:MliC family protein [Betaproteobacteria bacterium]
MTNKFIRATWTVPLTLCAVLLLGACSNFSLWPFGREEIRERPRTPTNASDYQCANSKRFYLRMLDNGGAAWIIFPDREVRLDKVAGSGHRYSNGIAVLTLNGSEATLEDGPANVFTGCKKTEK